MLNTAGKLLERLIKPRLTAAIEASGGLSPRQHGFRRGRSTIGAIQDVVNAVADAQNGSQHSTRIVLLATLDVRNAFNSVRWADIIGALEHRFSIPKYLTDLIRSYLKNRVLTYDTDDGQFEKRLTSGAAQGSILGPDLWNVSYDEILNLEMPDDTHLVALADDVAAVITARDTTEAQRKLNMVMMRVREWMGNHGLRLASEKTELLLLTKKHIRLEIGMRVCETTITSKRAVKYLGVHLDSRLTFWTQIREATTKAAKATASLSRLMANVGGPMQSKRKLLMATVNSILLYGSEIWANALHAKGKRKALASVQRTASLRVISAYRTVSGAASLVIAGTAPIDLLAAERKKKWDAKQGNGPEINKEELRRATMITWQERWNRDPKGRWTARLIPDIELYTKRRFGEVNYYLTQAFSGHGYFRKYLHKMGKARHSACIYGDSDEDDAEHTIFECSRWQEERSSLVGQTGDIDPDNLLSRMMESENNWKRIARFIEQILRKKKKDLDQHETQSEAE